MKNKKSKIIVPALGLILLSTAASISGSVAWFTANRTAQIQAGEFGVVKTGDDLAVTLSAGVGISAVDDSSTIKTITANTSYSLTDASFDHTNTTMPYVVVPDVPRAKALSNVALNDAQLSTKLGRGTNTYSAFTWNMTFTVSFSGSSTNDQGLFLDLKSSDTYMHEVETLKADQEIPATTYYTTADCKDASVVAAGTATGGEKYYKKAPDKTGKAFRIAFVPTAIGGTGTGTSTGYAKVWSANEGTTSNTYGTAGQFVYNVAAGNALAGTSYDTTTVQYSGTPASASYTAAAAGAGKVLMANDSTTTIPNDNTVNDSGALSGYSNYLGFFKADAGKTVSLTYTCVAWYEGTHPEINGVTTDFERIVASMRFGVSTLN